MKLKQLLLAGGILTTSIGLTSASYADFITYAGSSEEIDTSTGKPANDMGTKNYRPEDHPQQADTYPHSEPILIHGDQAGRIDQNGEVYNRSGEDIGTIGKDGTILSHGDQVGRIDSGGDVHSRNGEVVGSIGSSGNVLIHGDQAGRVDHNGEVYDRSGNDIGTVPAGNNAAGALMLLQNQNK
ncbi:hypothetical protein PT277_07990 [Acetobacteraceae bacterium ESL0709]|nr:hypothetical protein [Acetobacteraceae bacterium ESL0697]MDF7678620.1 hypothetical protein [Acetobacteraceae bacterium ESL0709]